MCRSLKEEQFDDEIYLIISKCCFEIAKEYFNHGKLRKSANMLDKACEYSKKTVYCDDNILSEAAIYYEYMARLSPSLSSENGNDLYSGSYLCADRFCRYALAIIALENDAFAPNMAVLSKMLDAEFLEHLKARGEMNSGDYLAARERLTRLINSDMVECQVILYDVFKDLEECCRETNDFKGAYEYSVGKVELLEHMLREAH